MIGRIVIAVVVLVLPPLNSVLEHPRYGQLHRPTSLPRNGLRELDSMHRHCANIACKSVVIVLSAITFGGCDFEKPTHQVESIDISDSITAGYARGIFADTHRFENGSKYDLREVEIAVYIHDDTYKTQDKSTTKLVRGSWKSGETISVETPTISGSVRLVVLFVDATTETGKKIKAQCTWNL